MVAKEYLQMHGVNFDNVYAPVSKHMSLRPLLAVVAISDMKLHQLDVKTTIRNGELEERSTCSRRRGTKGGPMMVCHLKETLYRLRQAPRGWHMRLKAELARGS